MRPKEREIDPSTVKGGQKLPAAEIEMMVERLSRPTSGKPVCDSNRTGALKESGVMNSFAWKGYN